MLTNPFRVGSQLYHVFEMLDSESYRSWFTARQIALRVTGRGEDTRKIASAIRTVRLLGRKTKKFSVKSCFRAWGTHYMLVPSES